MVVVRPQSILVFAEMFSVNLVIVLLGALKVCGVIVAKELAGSVVLGCGQFCTNPGLVIGIRSAEFSEFVVGFSDVIAS